MVKLQPPTSGQPQVEVTAWQLVGTTIGIVASILYVVWTVYQQNVTSDQKLRDDLQAHYLTIREHAEFVLSVRAELRRLVEEKQAQDTAVASRIETRQSQHEAQLALDSLNARIAQLQSQLDRLSARVDQYHLKPQ